MKFIDHPVHARTAEHYFDGDYGGRHLILDPEWWAAEMPPGVSGPKDEVHDPYALQVVYLDRQDGKTYETKIYVAWDSRIEVYFAPRDPAGVWEPLSGKLLQEYFYGQHHCPCHRKQDVSELGADTDDECEGDRFPIVKIFAPAHPELILYSETMEREELDALVEATRNEPKV